MSSIEATIERIADKLRRLREADTGFGVHGASRHQYRLEPVWTEAAVKAWEEEYGVELPADYRLFLQRVGDGPAGPGYGLCSLARFTDGGGIRRPFPFPKPFHGMRAEGDDTLDNRAKNEALTAACAVWRQIPVGQGALSLVDYGCGITGKLVLNGPFRGHIWIVDPNEPGCFPFLHAEGLHMPDGDCDWESTRALTFAEWYEHWLDHARPEAVPTPERKWWRFW
jgi:hypothetical protein